MNDRQQIHLLAAFVHGALTSLHLLGIAYNLRRGNKADAVVHAAAAGYSLRAVLKHTEQTK